MSKILIEHADYVVTMDGERRIIRDGAVAMVRSHQRGGEDPGSLEFGDAEIMDGRGKLVLPGLFDTHIHGAQQLGRGLATTCTSGFSPTSGRSSRKWTRATPCAPFAFVSSS